MGNDLQRWSAYRPVILAVVSFMNHRVSLIARESVRLLNEISKYIRVSGWTAAAWSKRGRVTGDGWIEGAGEGSEAG